MKKKVLLITQELTHYRIPLLQKLNENYELTVAHGTTEIIETTFKQISISFTSLGPFITIEKMPAVNKYDAIILTFNLRILSFYSLLLQKLKPKIFLWGIGVSASYKNRYDVNKRLDWLRLWWLKNSDGVIFYDNYPKIKFMAKGISSKKLFVAYNTIENQNSLSIHNDVKRRTIRKLKTNKILTNTEYSKSLISPNYKFNSIDDRVGVDWKRPYK